MQVIDTEIEAEKEAVEISSQLRKKKGRKPLPKELARVEVIHDIPEDGKAYFDR